MNNKTWCIYIHKNKINGKIYVGQTCQKPEHRWNNGEGYKGSPHFYSAIKKYGWDNFEHIILEKNLTLEQANKKEEYYIKILKTQNNKYGYNDRAGGSNSKLSEEQKKKISEKHKGIKQSQETINKRVNKNKGKKRTEQQKINISQSRCKKVICKNDNKIFNSIQEASAYYNCSKGNICSVCKGKRKNAGRHPITKKPLLWAYYESENDINE